MDLKSIQLIMTGLTIAFGALGPAIAMGIIASKSVEAIGRNPETANEVRATMLLALAIVESLAIFSLVMALIIKFVA